MTKASKLYAQILANRGQLISFRDFEQLLFAFGFELKRVKGSHRHYRHPHVPNVVTINPDGSMAHRYQVRLLLEYVETYGLHMNA